MIVKKLLDEFDEETIRLFVQKNADYYIAKWKVMAASGSKVSWNWAAFFFTSLWFGYRKMFLYAFIYILLNLVSFIPILGFIVWIVLWVGMGMFGNYFYAKKTYEALLVLKQAYPGETEFKNMVAKEGGTSIFGVIVVIVMALAIYISLLIFLSAYIGSTGYFY